ncbi:MAG: hypothetical protein JW869_00490 [Candidatus Omnitrophica bacterium]|nr:hypothetical protein [Candidatus Omnitrophota bacterium]
MKTLRACLVGLIICSLSIGQVYAAPKDKDKGNNGKAKGKEKTEKVKKSNKNNGNAFGHAKKALRSTPAAQKNNTEHSRNQSILRANIPDNPRSSVLHSPEKARRNNLLDKSRVKKVGDLLVALERARWMHNPHDERGQGNMGRPDMLDPFGHDKDSNREKSERARPIKETPLQPQEPQQEDPGLPEQNMDEPAVDDPEAQEPLPEQPPLVSNEEPSFEEILLSLSMDTYNEDYAAHIRWRIENIKSLMERYPENTETYLLAIQQYEKELAYVNGMEQGAILMTASHPYMDMGFYGEDATRSMEAGIMEYNLTFDQLPDEFIDKPLQITTTITSKFDYLYESVNHVVPGQEEAALEQAKEWYGEDIETWYNEEGELIFKAYEISHKSGDILWQQTQDFIWDGENSFSGVFYPTRDLAGNSGCWTDLTITITEPTTENTVSITCDRPIAIVGGGIDAPELR